MNKKLLLIGGGGHCRSVLSSVLAVNTYQKIGIVDFNGSSLLGVDVVGRDEDLLRLKDEGWTDAFITVGSIGNTRLRRCLYQMVVNYGFAVPAVIDPTAIIAQDAIVTEGCYVGKGAMLNSGSQIGRCAIINTGAIIEHDCQIGEFVHISPGTVLCGQVTIGNDSHIGAGSVVRQLIQIGKNSLIGAGSVVVSDVPEGVKAYGNPCKVVE